MLSRFEPMKVPATAVAIVAMLCASIANAQAPDPDSLTIEGTAGQRLGSYSMQKLRKEFPLHDITTATPWSKSDDELHYRGPLLKDILARNGISGASEFEILAYNDFVSNISGNEIETYAPILAIEQECRDADRADGICAAGQEFRPLSVEDGGPFYLIWPLEKLPPAYVPGRNSIWVWFVVTIRPAK
jgi:hypothetical protein